MLPVLFGNDGAVAQSRAVGGCSVSCWTQVDVVQPALQSERGLMRPHLGGDEQSFPRAALIQVKPLLCFRKLSTCLSWLVSSSCWWSADLSYAFSARRLDSLGLCSGKLKDIPAVRTKLPFSWSMSENCLLVSSTPELGDILIYVTLKTRTVFGSQTGLK